MGNPSAVKLGPGLLYIAPLGTTEPTTLTGALAAGFVALGYTEEGSEQEFEQTREPITVAEELWPIRHVTSAMVGKVSAALAEITATNLKRALNGGTISSPSGGFVTFDPPVLGTETSVMLVWQAEDDEERWLFRQVSNASTVTIQRRKGESSDDKATIPVEFQMEKPSGAEPFRAWFRDTLA